MLERTASSLEQCALHRIFTHTPRPAHLGRKLNSAFRQHGAATLELSAARAALPRTRTRAGTDSDRLHPTRLNPRSIRYDALQSLHHTGASLSKNRRPSSLFDPHDRYLGPPSLLQSRHISSVAPRHFFAPPQQPATSLPLLGAEGGFVQLAATERLVGEVGPRQDDPEPKTRPEPEHAPLPPPNDATPEAVRQLMTARDSLSKGRMWTLYQQLSEENKDALKIEVIRYLGHAPRRRVDVGRCWSLICRSDQPTFDDDVLLIAVQCSLEAGRHESALAFFRRNSRRDVGASIFKEILRASFETVSWPLLWTSWRIWHGREPRGVKPPSVAWLESVPTLPSAVLQHLEHLRSQSHYNQDRTEAEADVATGPMSNEDLDRHLSQSLDKFLLDVGRKAVLLPCKSSEAISILQTIGSLELYADHIVYAAENSSTTHLPQLFRTYKQLVGPNLDSRVLPAMFNVFYPHDRDGMLEVHEDFCRLHSSRGKGPSGDPAALRDWWSDYAARGAMSNQIQDPQSYQPFVQMFNSHGDPDTALFALTDVSERLGGLPNDLQWLERLKEYVRTKDYEGAMEEWRPRFSSDEPDVLTLVTLMELSSERGDLPFTLGLFEKAKEWGYRRSTQVLVPVVRAFGANDHLTEATKVCRWALDNGLKSTELFNMLVGVYASRNLIDDTRNVMKMMEENQIGLDQETYSHLIYALARTKRTSEASELLDKAPDAAFRGFTTHHYEAVMSGAVKTEKFWHVYRLAQRMKDEGLPLSLNAVVLLVKAGHRWTQLIQEKPKTRAINVELATTKDIVDCYRKTIEFDIANSKRLSRLSQNTSDESKPDEKPARTIVRRSSDPMALKRAAFALAEMGEREALEELASIYANRPFSSCSPRLLPSGMITAFMVMHGIHGNDGKVKDLWQILWDRECAAVAERSRSELLAKSTAPKMAHKQRYALDEGFKTMLKVLARQSDAEGLLTALNDIHTAGFRLGRKNWNHAIQALATMGRWKEAFTFCEKMLMPNWTGWRHMRKLKVMRRRRNSFERYVQSRQHDTEHGVIEKDEAISEEESRYRLAYRVAGDYLRQQYNARKAARAQKQRKLDGTSVNLDHRFLDPRTSPWLLSPNAHTLRALAEVYLDLQGAGGWASEACQWMSLYCPKTVHAIMTLKYADQAQSLEELHRERRTRHKKNLPEPIRQSVEQVLEEAPERRRARERAWRVEAAREKAARRKAEDEQRRAAWEAERANTPGWRDRPEPPASSAEDDSADWTDEEDEEEVEAEEKADDVVDNEVEIDLVALGTPSLRATRKKSRRV